MAAGQGEDSKVVERVGSVYRRLDEQLRRAGAKAGRCEACGKCCDFEAFDHRLFVTPPELIYLLAGLGAEKPKPMPGRRCPYNVAGKCTAYEHRFAGCRVFACRGDKDLHSELSESALREFKAICEELDIPYHYSDLATALNTRAET